METKQSKLIAIHSTDKTWSSDKYGLFYVHNLEFEDGTTGNALSKSNKDPWLIGQVYTFELHDKGSIKKMNQFKDQPGYQPRPGSYDDPEVQRSMAASASIHAAINFIRNSGQDIDKYDNTLTDRLAKKFFKYILVDVVTANDMFKRRSSLDCTIEEMLINKTILSTDDVLQRATLWLEYIDTVS